MLTANAAKINDVSDALEWCVVALIGATAGWLYIVVFSGPFVNLFREASNHVVKATLVVLAGSGVGVTFAIGITACARVIDLPDTEPLWWRLVATAVIFGWFGIIATLAFDARTRLRIEHSGLTHQAMALETARLSTTDMLDDLRREVAINVEQALIAARADIEHHIGDTQSLPDVTHWEVVAASLRNTASRTVRPLSHALWDSAPGEYRRPKAWSLLTYVVSQQPLRPLAVCTIYVLGGIAALVQRPNPETAAIELMVGVVIIATVMSTANTLMRKLPRRHALIFVAAALFLQSFVILNAWLPIRTDPEVSLVGTAASVAAGLIVILATSTFGAVRSMTQQQYDALAIEVDREFVESTARSKALAEVMREASSVMHGAVQSRLLGCAIAVEDAGKSQDAEQFSQALARARAELENPLPSLGRPAAPTLLEDFQRRRDLWDGLCAVTYEVAEGIPTLPEATVATCGRVVEEGISNAVRHGDARLVTITVGLVARDGLQVSALRITMHDDGTGIPSQSIRTGLGLRMISDASAAWSLTNVDGHACLVVDLALH